MIYWPSEECYKGRRPQSIANQLLKKQKQTEGATSEKDGGGLRSSAFGLSSTSSCPAVRPLFFFTLVP